MTHAQRALETFRRPHSCAQAVYCAFKEASEESMTKMKSCSGGRAPGGCCGALYAAKCVLPQYADAIDAQFKGLAGDLNCKVLKGELKIPCERCVEIAAGLVEKYGGF